MSAMAGSSWTNQLVNLIILSAAQTGFSGFFVYSPSPGPGNLIGSWAAAAGTDPYGNAYPAGLSVETGNFTGIDLFLYNGTPAAGNLLASVAAAAGADAHGNQYLQGIATYSGTFANAMIGGALEYFTGSEAGGWTFAAQIETDPGGDLIVETAGGTLTLSAAGNVTLSGGLTVSGTFSASGNTGSAGLPNGTINGTSGAASAGTAHTHGGGSYAVTNGVHVHPL
jgi:hypothetical protein